MNFIKTSAVLPTDFASKNEDTLPPVNLDFVMTIKKNPTKYTVSKGNFVINFVMSGGVDVIWTFPTKEQRDNVFDNLTEAFTVVPDTPKHV